MPTVPSTVYGIQRTNYALLEISRRQSGIVPSVLREIYKVGRLLCTRFKLPMSGASQNYPKTLDVWRCCNERFTRFSNIIDHIEHNHLLYRQEIAGRTPIGQAYKYNCETCQEKSFTFYKAIVHHLSRHVDFKIFCSQCMVLHTEISYHTHLRECNLLEEEIRRNIR